MTQQNPAAPAPETEPLSADYNAVIETYSASLAAETHKRIVAEAAARGYQREAADLKTQLAAALAAAQPKADAGTGD